MPTRNGFHVIVIAGPTAIGKTSLAIRLAKEFASEIISADSRQFYSELNIGVARPTENELSIIKHHFIADRSINDFLSAGQYAREAREKIDELSKTADRVIVTGGSGLHLKALISGIDDGPVVPNELREELQRAYLSNGLDAMQSQLKSLDPSLGFDFEWQNPKRVIRALEIVKSSGKPYLESFTPAKEIQWPVKTYTLEMPREMLYSRINRRVDKMMEDGLLEEVKSLSEYEDLEVMKTVGYSELFDYLDGYMNLGEAVDKIKQNSRRYAKRQMTWFRNQGDFKTLSTKSALNEIKLDSKSI